MKALFALLACCIGCTSARVLPAPRVQAMGTDRLAPSGKVVLTPQPSESTLIPAEPYSATWDQEEREPPATDRTVRQDAGACLSPVESERLAEPYEIFVRQALGLSDPTAVATMMVSPSFKHPWVLSVRRDRHGRSRLRVTKLDQDVWGVMMQRMRELQGDVVRLDSDQQTRALASIAVNPSVFERDIDRETANLLVALWRALVENARVFETDFGIADGTEYELSLAGRAGAVVSPDSDTILGNATTVAERLAAIIQSAGEDDHELLKQIRLGLRETLHRAQRKEPCVRIVKQ